jgi:hypothetical protein
MWDRRAGILRLYCELYVGVFVAGLVVELRGLVLPVSTSRIQVGGASVNLLCFVRDCS